MHKTAAGATVILALCALAIAQDPPAMLSENTTRISEHVSAIMGFPNIGIVTGDRGTLVVDTGLGPANGAIASRVAKKLSRGPILYLTTTHFHPEHAAGDAGFPSDTVLVRSATQQQEMTEHGAELLAVFGRNPRWAALLKDAKPRAPDVIFENETRLDLGGVTARILWLGASHTRGDQQIFVEQDAVLISGDTVQNKIVPGVFGEGGSLKSWLGVLDKLESLKPRIILPTHSAAGDGSLIPSTRAFIIDMRDRTLALKRTGVSATDAGKQMAGQFRAAYPEWANLKEWNNMNSIPGFVSRVYAEDK